MGSVGCGGPRLEPRGPGVMVADSGDGEKYSIRQPRGQGGGAYVPHDIAGKNLHLFPIFLDVLEEISRD